MGGIDLYLHIFNMHAYIDREIMLIKELIKYKKSNFNVTLFNDLTAISVNKDTAKIQI